MLIGRVKNNTWIIFPGQVSSDKVKQVHSEVMPSLLLLWTPSHLERYMSTSRMEVEVSLSVPERTRSNVETYIVSELVQIERVSAVSAN